MKDASSLRPDPQVETVLPIPKQNLLHLQAFKANTQHQRIRCHLFREKAICKPRKISIGPVGKYFPLCHPMQTNENRSGKDNCKISSDLKVQGTLTPSAPSSLFIRRIWLLICPCWDSKRAVLSSTWRSYWLLGPTHFFTRNPLRHNNKVDREPLLVCWLWILRNARKSTWSM